MLSDSNIAHTKDRIKQFHKMKLSIPVLPIPVTAKMVESITSQLSGMPKIPASFEIEATYKRLLLALENTDLASVDQRDWKIAAYALWYGNEKLGNKPEFLKYYLDRLNHQPLPSSWRRLIYVYLRDFKHRTDSPQSFAVISKAIRAAFTNPDLKHRLEQWKIRHDKFGLFAENFDLRKVTDAFSGDAQCDWRRFSDLTGLDGELSFNGYAEAVGLQLLNQVISNPKKEAVIAAQKYHIADKHLRFNDKRVQVIEALLSPWVKSNNALGEETRKSVHEWLLVQFHDPRLPVHERSGWRDVKSEYKKVMFRWLVGESLNQFFEIIDQVANEGHWKYRKAFWKAYYDSGVLDEAWVALGPDAKYYAQRVFSDKLSAGELNGVSDRKHSVLIVRIGDLVLADWSHNGKCRAWKIGDRACPETYKLEYNGFLLKSASMKIVDTHQEDGISHQGSENYRWQVRLADFIYDQTGIRIQHRDFRI
jgi:hypothetical protein